MTSIYHNNNQVVCIKFCIFLHHNIPANCICFDQILTIFLMILSGSGFFGFFFYCSVHGGRLILLNYIITNECIKFTIPYPHLKKIYVKNLPNSMFDLRMFEIVFFAHNSCVQLNNKTPRSSCCNLTIYNNKMCRYLPRSSVANQYSKLFMLTLNVP